MGAVSRRADHPVAARPAGDWLRAGAHRLDFFQAVRLIEGLSPGRTPVGEGAEPAREPVAFSSEVGLAFPVSDIARIRPPEAPGAPFGVSVNFMGLAGHAGPLPDVYTELIMDRAGMQDHALRDFLDVFNHRLVSLLYRTRKYHRVGFAPLAPEDSHVARYLFSLIGLGTDGLRERMDAHARTLLRHAGLLAQQPRSAHGLERLLEGYLQAPARVEPFVGQWHALDAGQVTRLGVRGGQNQALGAGAVLGGRFWDQASAFRLHLGPVPLARFLELLPIGDRHAALCELTEFYTNRAHPFDFVLRLDAADVPAARLSRLTGPRLGWTSWLAPRPLRKACPFHGACPLGCRTPDPGADPETGSDAGSTEAPPPRCVLAPAEVTLRLRPAALPPELEKLRIPLFDGLLPDTVRDVLEAMERLDVPEGTIVARQDKPAEALFVIERGAVQVLRAADGERDVVLLTLREGDAFGEQMLAPEGTYLTTFVTAEPCVLRRLSREALAGVVERHPTVGRTVDAERRRLARRAERYPRYTRRLAARLAALDVPLFRDLSTDGLCELADRITTFGFPAGRVVLAQGQPGTALYVVNRGRLQVVVRRADGTDEVVRTLGPGDAFGEQGLLYGTPRTATVVTTEPTELFELTRDALARVVRRYPPVEIRLRLHDHAVTRADNSP